MVPAGCAGQGAAGRSSSSAAPRIRCLRSPTQSPAVLPHLQVRAASLSQQPLTCVALLPVGSTAAQRHPLALCGGFDASVHAYCPATGSQLGSFQAAGDAVACVQVVGDGTRLATASWDGSVKLWELAEGRQPWAASFSQPCMHAAAPSGVWALAVSFDGHLALAGEERRQGSHMHPQQGSQQLRW